MFNSDSSGCGYPQYRVIVRIWAMQEMAIDDLLTNRHIRAMDLEEIPVDASNCPPLVRHRAQCFCRVDEPVVGLYDPQANIWMGQVNFEHAYLLRACHCL